MCTNSCKYGQVREAGNGPKWNHGLEGDCSMSLTIIDCIVLLT